MEIERGVVDQAPPTVTVLSTVIVTPTSLSLDVGISVSNDVVNSKADVIAP